MKSAKLFLVIVMTVSFSTLYAQDKATVSEEKEKDSGCEKIKKAEGCEKMEKTSGCEKKQAEEGEESGTDLALNETYDVVRNGARLILVFDAESNSFDGTVENTTKKTLTKVRVEVHLANGVELGPTKPTDLEPGAKMDIKLVTTSKDFKGWTAHPEVGSMESGHGEESGEHSREKGEHKGEHKRERKEH